MPVIVPFTPLPAIRDLIVGRMQLPTVDSPITEQLGSELTLAGESIAVGQRKAKGFVLTWRIHATPGDVDWTATGNRMRRQVRSMMQNPRYRLEGWYVRLGFDPERNGWLIVGAGELADDNGGVPFGDYKLTLADAYLVAQQATHRDACRCALVDRRLTTSTIDLLELIPNSTAGFAALTPLGVLGLPVSASDVSIRDVPTTVGGRAGRDGTVPILPCANGDVVSFEQAEDSMGLGDVVVYDRRGSERVPVGLITPERAGWEEVYGPVWPWADPTNDTPVLDNSLCRVRWDADQGTQPGFMIEAYESGDWVQQGKVTIFRDDTGVGGLGAAALDTLISSTLIEYSQNRAVILAILGSSTDPRGRDRVYLTLQRGWAGPRVEVYSAPGVDGTTTNVLAVTRYVIADVDPNDTVVQGEAGGIAVVATAGSGSALFPSATLGGFTRENQFLILREGKALSPVVAVLQPAAIPSVGTDAAAYGAARSTAQIVGPSGGYLSVHLGFAPQLADQILEAEAERYTSSSTASEVADAGGSGGQCVKDTQTSESAFTLYRGSTDLLDARYRVLARVKVGAGVTGSFRATLGSTAVGSVVTATSTGWVWIDLGELQAPDAGCSVVVTGWRSAGSSSAVYIDRVELVLLEDRVRDGASYAGGRDLGQQALYDSRAQVRRVPRG